MAPQDDLMAAERAKALTLKWFKGTRQGRDYGAIGFSATEWKLLDTAITEAIQQTRQAALREAREVVLAEVLEDIPDNEADEAYNIAIGHAAHALDRLASEGG